MQNKPVHSPSQSFPLLSGLSYLGTPLLYLSGVLLEHVKALKDLVIFVGDDSH